MSDPTPTNQSEGHEMRDPELQKLTRALKFAIPISLILWALIVWVALAVQS